MMSDDKKLVPQIRFKGYSNAWEHKQLSDVAPLQRGFDLPKTEMKAGKIPVVMSNGINGYHSNYKVKAPGVVTGRSGTIGNIIFVEENYWPHNTALWVTNFFENYPKFIYHLYHNIDLSRFSTGTGVPTLNRNDIHDKYVCIPKLEEQKKITEFLDNLDCAISLRKQKLEKLIRLKKAYLQQMFPQNGESVPRLRFGGVTGDWQERKLGAVLKVNSGRDYKHLNDGNVPVFGTGGYMLSVDESLSEIDAIGIGRKGTIDNPQLLSAPFWTVDTLFFLTPLQNNNLLFMYALSQNIEWSKMDESTGVPSLSKVNIEKVDICVPGEVEQAFIGDLFRNLDAQITAQTAKLEQLKQLKQAYLQKMFA